MAENETYENCMDCPRHLVAPDPDPTDWFEDDDELVLCTFTKERRNITVACRPHRKRFECKTPSWCPLLVNSINNTLHKDKKWKMY